MDLAGFEPRTLKSPIYHSIIRAIKTTQSALFHLNNVTIRQPVSDKKSTSYCYEWQNSLF